MNHDTVKYPPAFYRFRARRALKGHWLTALQVALVVSFLPWLVRGIFSYTSGELAERLTRIQELMLQGSFDYRLADQFLQDYGPHLALFAGLEAAAYLIIPCLSLGMNQWMMNRLKEREEPFTAVFCRVRLFFKACGLEILTALKILLWMLPGMCLTILVTVLFVQIGEAPSEILSLMQAYLISVLPFSMIVPAFFAYLRYALAEYILADKPETKIRECIRHSKELMKRNRRIIVLNLLVFFLYLLASSLLGGLPGILYYVLTLLFSLFITAYWACTISAFYLDAEYGIMGRESAVPEEQAEDRPEDLN